MAPEARGSDGNDSGNFVPARGKWTKKRIGPETAVGSFPSPLISFCAQCHGLNRSKTRYLFAFTKKRERGANHGPGDPLEKIPLVGATLLHQVSSPESAKKPYFRAV